MATPKKPDHRAASAVDKQIGLRIRARRLEIGQSQEELARQIRVTFQQIQKYEKGVNRVAASTLIDIAKALQVAPAALLPAGSEKGAEKIAMDDPELGLLIARLNAEGRRMLAKLARTLVDDAKLAKRRSND